LDFTDAERRGGTSDVDISVFGRLVAPMRQATRDEIEQRPRVIRFHDLRHTHASQLLAGGLNVKLVSERLGHASTAQVRMEPGVRIELTTSSLQVKCSAD